MTKSPQQTGGQTYVFQGPGGAAGYEYNLADQLRKQYLPSGRLIETAYTAGGKPSLLKGKFGLLENVYAQEMAYSAAEMMTSVRYGEALREISKYNARHQFETRTANKESAAGSQMMLFLRNTYGGGANNGNLITQETDNGARRFTVTHNYDGANRVWTSTETTPGATTWSQTFGYNDAFGNRTASSSSSVNALPQDTLEQQAALNPATNRLTNAAYDNAGNQTQINP